ncbi:hypothetical protein CCHL11_04745 [Colletotrichum chlorophyti]|uniref:DUF2293 domain-containing protein n=1 Tax=Colletotrichum chlorophyti TaxID=708187 RepID=A0A1Q8S1S9_9PEZI|nr:hypothetical protein CCHL11_04745 [Colletotrichum chlorophyti]
MGREKKTQPGPGATAKDRHKKAGKASKAIDRNAPLPPGLVAMKPANQITKIKHKSYFELIENKDKKEPLVFDITSNKQAPPGMKFIPIGNPELTEACKDISRKTGAMLYIVTKARKDASELSQQIHRIGHHFRENIVDQALLDLGMDSVPEIELVGEGEDQVEKIPEDQAEINEQADAALRELFPRIPNTDRQEIINHAFHKGRMFNGELVVGLQQNLSLSRRVQLAVLAHIRHNHTRYDELLRETTWNNARRATEQLCLDILVKWRGDDENGRNQLDEILREVVVLSDDSDDEEDSGEEPESDSSEIVFEGSRDFARMSAPVMTQHAANARKRLSTAAMSRPGSPVQLAKPGVSKRMSKKARKRAKHRERNFGRYEAARNAAWDEAQKRQRQAPNGQTDQANMPDGSVSHGPYPHGQPTAFSDDRAPFIDVRPLHPQPRPHPGPFGNGFYETRPQMDGHFATAPQPTRSGYLSSGPVVHKVNGSSSSASRGPIGRDEAHLPQDQLQDFLHPSIEPRSPDAVRPPSRFARGPIEYTDRRDELQSYRSPPRGVVVRGERLMYRHEIPQSYHFEKPLSERHSQVQISDVSFRNAPHGTGYQPAQEYGSGRRFDYVNRAPRREDQFVPRHEPGLGDKTNSIMIEGQNVRPDLIYLNSGESVRERFGHDPEILAIRQPQHDAAPTLSRQPHAPRDEGFIRLREARPTEYRLGFEEEGFLRLREHNDDIPQEPAFTSNRRPPQDDARSGYRPYQHRPVEPEHAIYVRRAERPLQTNLSYDAPSYRRVERVQDDRVIHRDPPSSMYGGVFITQKEHMVFLSIVRLARLQGSRILLGSTDINHSMLHAALGRVQMTTLFR